MIGRQETYHRRQGFQHVKEAPAFFLRHLLCAVAAGNIPCRGKHSEDISFDVPVDGGIVKNVYSLAALVLEG